MRSTMPTAMSGRRCCRSSSPVWPFPTPRADCCSPPSSSPTLSSLPSRDGRVIGIHGCRSRRRAMAIFYAAMPVGTALGYAVGGAVGSHLGWQAAFFVAGAPGLLLALSLLSLREPPRGAFEGGAPPAASPLALGASLRALAARPSYVSNPAVQVLYTFSMGGLAVWMPTYFVRERHIPLTTATTSFGALLLIAGFLGTLAGGQLGDRVARRLRGAQFAVSGWSLIASLGFTLAAVLSPDPAVFWPAMFGSLFLLFLNVGPLNAAMANVLPADLRARGFAITILAIHMLGDAASPWLIGVVSDRVGLTAPVLGAGALLGVSGIVLLAGRNALDRDTQAVAHSGEAIKANRERMGTPGT